MLLSSVVVVLVGTTFLVQNRYYATEVKRALVHDNARAVTDLLTPVIRSVTEGGVVVAGPRTLTVRTPIVIAVVCNRQANFADVYNEGGESAIDTLEVAGVALRDTLTGAWTYANTDWSNIDGSGGAPANDCAAKGADTTGVAANFHRIRRLASLTGLPDEGDLLMIFRETTFSFAPSAMDSSTWALYRQPYGQTPVEYATGIDTTAAFQYRVNGSYVDTVSAGQLDLIDAVRISANARLPAPTGGVEDVSFGWSVNIQLRNLRAVK